MRDLAKTTRIHLRQDTQEFLRGMEAGEDPETINQNLRPYLCKGKLLRCNEKRENGLFVIPKNQWKTLQSQRTF
jgi:hypothetical protein